MPTLWQQLLSAGHLNAGVIVDPAQPPEATIVAVGLTAFLAESFVQHFLSDPEPSISSKVYEALLAGGSPILAAADVRRANTDGNLNLLVMHFGMRLSAPPSARDLAVVEAAHRLFQATHAGYRVKLVMQEAIGAAQVAFMTAGGFRVVDDFSAYYSRNGIIEPDKATRPYLMAARRDEVEQQLPGSTLSVLFRHAVPRFKFTAAEQRVLQWTLLDEDDRAIADYLGVSPDAVKKIWRRVYERVAAVDATLLDAVTEESERVSSGKQKRVRLVRYLRNHAEELRPFK